MDSRLIRLRVPEYLYQHPDSRAILDALDRAANRLEAAVADAMAQTNVATATWSLPDWEKSVGIQAVPNSGTEARRQAVMARMRGAGPTTPEQIRSVAEAFTNGEVAVMEYPNQHTLEIKFVGTVGIPEDIDLLTAAIRDIIPAHLAWSYLFIYATWADIADRTWSDLAAHTWNEVKEMI